MRWRTKIALPNLTPAEPGDKSKPAWLIRPMLNIRRSEIEAFLNEHPRDLVVLGTKGLTGSRRLRLGSVSDYLAHHIDASMLLVRDAYQ